jgi:hypothetical protein
MIYKVEASNKDFKEVLKRTKVTKKLGKANLAIEEVEFHYADGELKVIVVGSERIVAAKGLGHWSTCIPLLRYRALSKLPPIGDPLVIEYDPENNRLKIGTTVFKSFSSEEL